MHIDLECCCFERMWHKTQEMHSSVHTSASLELGFLFRGIRIKVELGSSLASVELAKFHAANWSRKRSCRSVPATVMCRPCPLSASVAGQMQQPGSNTHRSPPASQSAPLCELLVPTADICPGHPTAWMQTPLLSFRQQTHCKILHSLQTHSWASEYIADARFQHPPEKTCSRSPHEYAAEKPEP